MKRKITQLKEQVDKKGNLLYGDQPGCWSKGCEGPIRWTAVEASVGRQQWCDKCKREALGEPLESAGVKADL